MKIVVLDGEVTAGGEQLWGAFEAFGEVVIYPRTQLTEVSKRISDADAVLTNKVPLDTQALQEAKQLKYIGVLATGFNIIDLKTAHARGITVTNVPDYSSASVAQLTFAHILNIVNRVDAYACDNRKGRWTQTRDFCYWDEPQHELAGKTLGIVGLGNIGSKVAAIAHVFGMDVFAVTSKPSSELPAGIMKTTLEGLLGTSDIISLHCPLTENTRELINKDSLAKMRKGAILINTARGALVNEQHVADALAKGRLAAYGTDVLSQEPPLVENPLLSQPHAYITPHIAWATVEARARLLTVAVENLKAFINGNSQNVV